MQRFDDQDLKSTSSNTKDAKVGEHSYESFVNLVETFMKEMVFLSETYRLVEPILIADKRDNNGLGVRVRSNGKTVPAYPEVLENFYRNAAAGKMDFSSLIPKEFQNQIYYEFKTPDLIGKREVINLSQFNERVKKVQSQISGAKLTPEFMKAYYEKQQSFFKDKIPKNSSDDVSIDSLMLEEIPYRKQESELLLKLINILPYNGDISAFLSGALTQFKKEWLSCYSKNSVKVAFAIANIWSAICVAMEKQNLMPLACIIPLIFTGRDVLNVEPHDFIFEKEIRKEIKDAIRKIAYLCYEYILSNPSLKNVKKVKVSDLLIYPWREPVPVVKSAHSVARELAEPSKHLEQLTTYSKPAEGKYARATNLDDTYDASSNYVASRVRFVDIVPSPPVASVELSVSSMNLAVMPLLDKSHVNNPIIMFGPKQKEAEPQKKVKKQSGPSFCGSAVD